jgi:DNA-directed RNA polymerase specialized sigma subunit
VIAIGAAATAHHGPLLQPHPFREIPVRMGVTKGRVSQLHHDALNRLRDVMRELR